jgi:hypothetical protein
MIINGQRQAGHTLKTEIVSETMELVGLKPISFISSQMKKGQGPDGHSDSNSGVGNLGSFNEFESAKNQKSLVLKN